MRNIFTNIVAVGVGGALGALFRALINVYTAGVSFPIGTLFENLIGSFLLGALTGWIVHRHMKEWIRQGFGGGFCGGFTTMSTLIADTVYLHTVFTRVEVLVYLICSLFGGVALAFAGYVGAIRIADNTERKRGEGV